MYQNILYKHQLEENLSQLGNRDYNMCYMIALHGVNYLGCINYDNPQ
jgi:hypothetical protein